MRNNSSEPNQKSRQPNFPRSNAMKTKNFEHFVEWQSEWTSWNMARKRRRNRYTLNFNFLRHINYINNFGFYVWSSLKVDAWRRGAAAASPSTNNSSIHSLSYIEFTMSNNNLYVDIFRHPPAYHYIDFRMYMLRYTFSIAMASEREEETPRQQLCAHIMMVRLH